MLALEDRLQAQITAQNLVIEALLDATIAKGALDANELLIRLEQFVTAPKLAGLKPEAVTLTSNEVEAWADMVFGLYLD
ncbi:hypothetical protein HZU77_013465 [Neisseriaceae bacterium TC5R-5]|nr:hypothetical protein [Neisseriaceae bacterium TC5R-5]